jgi:hypothetical protein
VSRDSARLHADQSILDDVGPADAMAPADPVQLGKKIDRSKRPAVHRNWRAAPKTDCDFLRFRGRVLGISGQQEEILWRRLAGVFENTAFMGDVPEVAVARIDLGRGGRHRNAACRGVRQRILTAPDVPLPPRRNDLELGCECHIGQLKADLIIPLSRAAVRESVSAHGARHFDLPPGDKGAGDGGAEEVLAIVDRAGPQRRENEGFDELLPQILHGARDCAGPQGLFDDSIQFALALPDIGGDTNDLRVVMLTKPGTMMEVSSPRNRRALCAALTAPSVSK